MIKKVIDKLMFKSYHFLSEENLINKIFNKKGIIVLMYHSITKQKSFYPYAINEKTFQQQMDFLSQYCDVISIDEMYNILLDNKDFRYKRPKTVITFDDGYRNNYSIAYPILKKFNLPFTIFLTTDFIEKENKSFMSWEDIKKLQGEYEKVNFGSHSVNHFNLTSLENEDKYKEIVDSKKIIEDKIGKNVDYFAYPSGGYDKYCLKIVEENYKLGFKDRMNVNNSLKAAIGRVSIDKRHIDFKSFLIELAFNNFILGDK